MEIGMIMVGWVSRKKTKQREECIKKRQEK